MLLMVADIEVVIVHNNHRILPFALTNSEGYSTIVLLWKNLVHINRCTRTIVTTTEEEKKPEFIFFVLRFRLEQTKVSEMHSQEMEFYSSEIFILP